MIVVCERCRAELDSDDVVPELPEHVLTWLVQAARDDRRASLAVAYAQIHLLQQRLADTVPAAVHRHELEHRDQIIARYRKRVGKP